MEFKLRSQYYPQPHTLTEAEIYTTLHRAKMNVTRVSNTRDALHEPLIAEVMSPKSPLHKPSFPIGYAIVSFKIGHFQVWNKRSRQWNHDTRFTIIDADDEFKKYVHTCVLNEKIRQIKIIHEVIEANEKLLVKHETDLTKMTPEATLAKFDIEESANV